MMGLAIGERRDDMGGFDADIVCRTLGFCDARWVVQTVYEAAMIIYNVIRKL